MKTFRFPEGFMWGTATASYCVEDVGTARIADLGRDQVASRVDAIRALYGGI